LYCYQTSLSPFLLALLLVLLLRFHPHIAGKRWYIAFGWSSFTLVWHNYTAVWQLGATKVSQFNATKAHWTCTHQI